MTACRTHAPGLGSTTVVVLSMKTWISCLPVGMENREACMNLYCLVKLLPSQVQALLHCQLRIETNCNLAHQKQRAHCHLKRARWVG